MEKTLNEGDNQVMSVTIIFTWTVVAKLWLFSALIVLLTTALTLEDGDSVNYSYV